jgi:hypothetical protein
LHLIHASALTAEGIMTPATIAATKVRDETSSEAMRKVAENLLLLIKKSQDS